MGSGGPGMEAASLLRKALRHTRELFKANARVMVHSTSHSCAHILRLARSRCELICDYILAQTFGYLEEFSIAFNELAVALKKLGTSLLDFVDTFYNEKMMRLLDHWGKTLLVSSIMSSPLLF